MGSSHTKRGIVGSSGKADEYTSERGCRYRTDILAPGENIASCLSPEKDTGQSIVINKNYILMSGTSMATPMVSGAAALLLEKEPGLDSVKVRERLINSSSGGLLNIKNLLRL